MPQMFCPNTLYQTCILAVVDHFDVISDSFLNTTCPSHILANIITTMGLHERLEWRHLHNLIRSNLCNLDLNHYYKFNDDWNENPIWDDLPALLAERTCGNLQELDLSGCERLTADHLCKLIQSLPNLKTLRVSGVHSCSDQVLHELWKSCPFLVALHLSGCQQVTDAGFMTDEPKAWFKELKVLSVDGTNMTPVGASFVLANCPKLQDFDFPDMQNVIAHHFIEDMMKTGGETCREYQLRVLTVNSFTHTSRALLHLRSCPFLGILQAKMPNSDVSIFPQMKHLQHLDITNESGQQWTYEEYVLPILERLGKKLSVLKLSNITNIDLVSLCKLCPSLQNLRLDSNQGFEPVSHEEIGACEFQMLETLSAKSSSSGELSDSHILLLLGQSRNISKISLKSCQAFSDDLFNKVILLNPLKCLKCIRLYECHFLTMASIRVVLKMCNDFNWLYLENCMGIDNVEFNEIKEFVEENFEAEMTHVCASNGWNVPLYVMQ